MKILWHIIKYPLSFIVIIVLLVVFLVMTLLGIWPEERS